MNTTIHLSRALLIGAAILFTTMIAEARPAYGVHTGSRGTAVSTPRGVAWSGDNSSGAVTRRGAAVSTNNGTVVARRPAAAPLPRGYVHTIPGGYRQVVYGGYNCYYVSGVYYRPVIYQGTTVYIVVN